MMNLPRNPFKTVGDPPSCPRQPTASWTSREQFTTARVSWIHVVAIAIYRGSASLVFEGQADSSSTSDGIGI